MKRLCLIFVLLGLVTSLSAQSHRSVLIRTARPYDGIVQIIEQAGGQVTQQFKHVNGLAADVPESALLQLERMVGADNIGRDDLIPLPETSDPRGGLVAGEAEAEDVVTLDTPGTGIAPANFAFNAALTNVAPLHAAGHTGAGIVIAVIDSGYRPIKVHIAPARIITPGLNLVPGASEPPAISDLNGPHGTFVAGMAAASVAFCFSAANKFVVVAEFHGGAFASPACAATSRLVPMVGSAPGAGIFPIKVFPAAGGGAPTSRVIAAMEAAIDLRRKYDSGEPGGLNIRVANLSLGGSTNAAARELDDEAVEALINADIVPVIAAGNEGHSSVTTGSPSTSFAALTVGSANDHRHEQIFRAQFSAPCSLASTPLSQALACAQSYRPDTNMQISEFSSRGPTHDGRPDPDVVAVGSFNFSQASGGATTVNFGSGTSYSTPTLSGIAAVLRQAVPTATARQVRRAIVESANPIVPTAGANDQGAGFVNAAAALARLQAGDVEDSYSTAPFTRDVRANLERAGHHAYAGPITLRFEGVRPAEVTDIPYVVSEKTEQLFVRIHSIGAALPPAQQNPFFTDDVFLKIQSSMVHSDDLRQALFIVAGVDRLFTFNRPEEGIWRISPAGDWTNAGTVSYSVDIWTTTEVFPQHTAEAQIGHGETHVYSFDVPVGTAALETRLTWMNMNGSYPISDVDVILTPPSGPVVNSCNSVRTPEVCVVANPVAGTWTARVVGFSIPGFGVPSGGERYTLRIEADAVVIKINEP